MPSFGSLAPSYAPDDLADARAKADRPGGTSAPQPVMSAPQPKTSPTDWRDQEAHDYIESLPAPSPSVGQAVGGALGGMGSLAHGIVNAARNALSPDLAGPAALGDQARAALGGVAAIPQRAIEGSQADLATMGSGAPMQSVGPATDAAMLMMGGASPFAEEGALGATGGKLTAGDKFRQQAYDTQNDFYWKGRMDAQQQYWKDIESGKSTEDIRREKGYTTPAYRGMRVYQEGQGPAEIHNVNQSPDQYSSASPMLADMYSSYLDKHPGWNVGDDSFQEGAQVLPLRLDTSKYHYFDAKGEHWTYANGDAIKEAKAKGAPGVVVDNVWDEPNSTHSMSRPQKIFITFPEGATTVKSRFASKFDPNDPNMMHGIAAVGLGGPLGGYVANQAADPAPPPKFEPVDHNPFAG